VRSDGVGQVDPGTFALGNDSCRLTCGINRVGWDKLFQPVFPSLSYEFRSVSNLGHNDMQAISHRTRRCAIPAPPPSEIDRLCESRPRTFSSIVREPKHRLLFCVQLPYPFGGTAESILLGGSKETPAPHQYWQIIQTFPFENRDDLEVMHTYGLHPPKGYAIQWGPSGFQMAGWCPLFSATDPISSRLHVFAVSSIVNLTVCADAFIL